MATVFAIEEGSYSDYHVVGVFTSREKAEQVLAAIRAAESYSSPTIAEWPLDPGVEELNAGLEHWRVLMLKNGDTERVEKTSFDVYDIGGSVSVWKRTEAPAYRGKGVPDVLQMTVWASDKEHALKIANEHRLAWIAAGKF